MTDHGPFLVTGATGTQGGAVAGALMAKGQTVRTLVRDPASPAARRLADHGVVVFRGDMDDAASLTAAVNGATGVFSVQVSGATDVAGRETCQGLALIAAARRAGVAHFVHSSVARAGDHRSFAHPERWPALYWVPKAEVNDAVRSAGFAAWTILKPAFMMDNFSLPKAASMFPSLARGRIDTAMLPETKLDLIAASDIAAFAAQAFLAPRSIGGRDIPLAAERLTMTEIATTLGDAIGRPIKVFHHCARAAIAAGVHPGFVDNQLWANIEGYRVDPAMAAHCGLALTSLAEWARANVDRLPGV